jgi:hypothetical protein
MLSMIRPRFAVENKRVRRKPLGSGLSASCRDPPYGPKKIIVGCVILTEPRRNRVSHAVVTETNSDKTEITKGEHPPLRK